MKWLTRSIAKIQCGSFERSIWTLQHAQSKCWSWMKFQTGHGFGFVMKLFDQSYNSIWAIFVHVEQLQDYFLPEGNFFFS